jgi:iduronate 2-sulfatase
VGKELLMKGLLSALFLLCHGFVLANEKKNILMIAVDDLRPMLSCYGDERISTPNFDRLADSAMLFERAYCNYAKCGASRMSLMTGLMPGTIGVYTHRNSDIEKFRQSRTDAVPMSRWFREAGYEVRSFGKIDHDGWAVPSDWSKPPFAGRNGEMLEVVEASSIPMKTIIADRANCPVAQSPDVDDDFLFGGRMVNEVNRLLGEPREKPFFFAVGFRRPHLPFVAPKRYYDLHKPEEWWLAPNPDPPKGAPVLAWFNSDDYGGMMKKVGDPMPDPLTRDDAIALNGFEMRSYVGAPVRGGISTAKQLELLHAYAACVSYVDAQIGKILDQVDESELRENTIIMLWSDHGWHLGEMSTWGKMTNYEISTRIPFMVSVPGLKSGRTSSLAALIDVYPTLCDLTGVEAPEHLEGSSLVPILENEGATVNGVVRHLYARYKGAFMGHAVRTDRYRYVRWTNWQGKVVEQELYDLQSDPLETVNIVADHPELAQNLEAILD